MFWQLDVEDEKVANSIEDYTNDMFRNLLSYVPDESVEKIEQAAP